MDDDQPSLILTVAVETPQWHDVLQNGDTLCREAANATLTLARPDLVEGEISVVLTDDEEVRSLNHRWRHKNKPTNVLSFPGVDLVPGEPLPSLPGGILLGDVVLALETVQREAEAEGKRLADHVRHLVTHGVLHLLGYDHQTEAEASVMEGVETRVLAGLGIDDPYAMPVEDAA
ncbi:rRNA maturation RNase YbeY [Marinivivus vitaminiproducens]|uniref:rRNA maturation RNase YbeY n=1 Tax=Marinivivus vitaminiproducens TaxID=3035935 RepID=UPI0027AB0943|nr:rRNA maturation RNase YbeY [Geminicoccaceae bacterium SCSIO 64248]